MNKVRAVQSCSPRGAMPDRHHIDFRMKKVAQDERFVKLVDTVSTHGASLARHFGCVSEDFTRITAELVQLVWRFDCDIDHIAPSGGDRGVGVVVPLTGQEVAFAASVWPFVAERWTRVSPNGELRKAPAEINFVVHWGYEAGIGNPLWEHLLVTAACEGPEVSRGRRGQAIATMARECASARDLKSIPVFITRDVEYYWSGFFHDFVATGKLNLFREPGSLRGFVGRAWSRYCRQLRRGEQPIHREIRGLTPGERRDALKNALGEQRFQELVVLVETRYEKSDLGSFIRIVPSLLTPEETAAWRNELQNCRNAKCYALSEALTNNSPASDKREETSMLLQAVKRIVRSLTIEEKLLLRLILQGKSKTEIAGVLGVHPGTVARRIEKLQKRLRRELEILFRTEGRAADECLIELFDAFRNGILFGSLINDEESTAASRLSGKELQ